MHACQRLKHTLVTFVLVLTLCQASHSLRNRYRYCKSSHINFNTKKGLAYIKSEPNRVTKCCCLFNEPWPEFVEPKVVGAGHLVAKNLRHERSCLPLVMGINLSKSTRKSYEKVCDYLSKKEPLTLVELIDYSNAAAQLNYMKPKHPSIVMTLKHKNVAKVDFEAAEKIKDIVFRYYLDSNKPWDHYEGFNLRYDTLKEMNRAREEGLQNILESSVVSGAFDDFITSYSVVDIAAASQRVEYLNHEALRLPQNILLNQSAGHNRSGKELYFRLAHLNCGLLRETLGALTVYLAQVKMVLDSLKQKLVFEYLSENYPKLGALIHYQQIYRELKDVNCSRNKAR